jgi:hypothetical protein
MFVVVAKPWPRLWLDTTGSVEDAAFWKSSETRQAAHPLRLQLNTTVSDGDEVGRVHISRMQALQQAPKD